MQEEDPNQISINMKTYRKIYRWALYKYTHNIDHILSYNVTINEYYTIAECKERNINAFKSFNHYHRRFQSSSSSPYHRLSRSLSSTSTVFFIVGFYTNPPPTILPLALTRRLGRKERNEISAESCRRDS